MNWSKISLFIGLLPFFSLAQAPQKISYQAVIRNANNTVLISKPIGLKISVLNGASSPVTVYEETQSTFTNAFGLINLQIGAGKVVSGEMSKINWAKGPYFIKTDIDPDGGANYVLSGLTELTSVPYALFALTSGISQETVNGGESVPGPQGERGLTGLAGDTGLTGAAGATGLAGAAGSVGSIGLSGVAGADGVAGPRGLTGLSGTAGAEGPRGLTGIPGTNGSDGTQGIPGTAGANGIDGSQGIIGLTGNIGADGPRGLIGLQGTNGSNGTQGISGTNGVNGIDGAQGTIGLTGNVGAEGPRGLTGLQGTVGPIGLIGLSGTNGSNGTQGLPGTNGSNGTQGIPGTNGTNGAAGATGLTGTTGVRGLPGINGTNGATGTPGIQGDPGPQGNPGLDGHDQVKFNKSLAPITFEGDPKVTADQIFNSGIFVSLKGDTSFTFPELRALIEMLGEKATDGDVITILIGSNTGITTLIPGAGGSIIGPDTVLSGQTRVVYIRFDIKAGSYFIY